MDQITIFDVLIVYSERLANSANSASRDIGAPFAKGSSTESYNLVYSYFLETCKRNNLKAAFTTSADVVGAGKCKAYWLFENKNWIKVQNPGFSKLIFDKFSPTNKKIKASHDLLFSSNKVRPFNNRYLFNLCFDKQKTYNKLRKFSIPTVAIDGNTKQEFDKKCKLLNKRVARHPHKDDFSDEIIMKDRFGSGGRNVYKFKITQHHLGMELIKRYKKISFIIQPFVKFDKGFTYQNSPVPTDIRVIYLGKKIVQTYIRMAKKGDFRCNEHRGGLLKYLPQNKLPSKVLTLSEDIAKIIYEKPSLFALDFIISNNGNVYLLEANTGPGLDWNLSIKENEIESKKLMRIIIKEIARRTSLPRRISKRNAITQAPVTTPIISQYPALSATT